MRDLNEFIGTMVPVVQAAGDKILEIRERGAAATLKGDGSPVTEADQAAENIILAALADVVPDITVISEENAASHTLRAPERFVLVDPLDGTKEFLKENSKGGFTVNIALIENRRPVLGIVFAPVLNRMFTGIVGIGAQENGAPIAIRKVPDSGPVAVASASHRDEQTDHWLADHNISDTVSIGSSLKFCLVAAGEADVYPRFGPTMEWDTAAGDAVLRAAGGTVSNPDNTPFLYAKPDYRNGAFIAKGGF